MGGKQTRGREHICLCVAILIFLSLLGCNFKAVHKREAARHLEYGRQLLVQKNYEDALREYQKVISISPQAPPADEALFYIGLICAHPGNPRKDYEKSASYFKKLIKEFPQSPSREPARILIGMLQDIESLNRTIERLSHIIEESKRVDIQLEEKKKEETEK
jgi:outer membrane protein assembly factor BamD (BamD/ComL family)